MLYMSDLCRLFEYLLRDNASSIVNETVPIILAPIFTVVEIAVSVHSGRAHASCFGKLILQFKQLLLCITQSLHYLGSVSLEITYNLFLILYDLFKRLDSTLFLLVLRIEHLHVCLSLFQLPL